MEKSMVNTDENRSTLVPGEYLTPQQVVDRLPGVSLNNLAARRHRHLDPPFCRLGRVILYPEAELTRWIQASTHTGAGRAR